MTLQFLFLIQYNAKQCLELNFTDPSNLLAFENIRNRNPYNISIIQRTTTIETNQFYLLSPRQ